MKYKIAIVAHGRFTTIQMARALLAHGHDVQLFTSYPKWAVPRFGFPQDRVTCYWTHGIASRVCWMLNDRRLAAYPERRLHEAFGRWAAKTVTRHAWDIVYCYSGGSEELFEALKGSSAGRWLARGSSHIRTQAGLLMEEWQRAGVPIDKPSEWMIAREEREYELADVIVTQSTFASQSFPASLSGKVLCIPLGVQVEHFRAHPEVILARRQRIRDGHKLRLLFVGTKSYRKGLIDLATIVRTSAPRFQFKFVGPTEANAVDFVNRLKLNVEIVPAVPERELPSVFAWGDVFIFPTIEDGFAVVLAQAHASGLPILATTNCSAPDFIRVGETGWILPIRSPEAFVERLIWCDEHRDEVANMVARIDGEIRMRTWDDVARDFETAIAQRQPQRSAQPVGVRS